MCVLNFPPGRPGAGGCHATQDRFSPHPSNPRMGRQPWLLQGSCRGVGHIYATKRLRTHIDPLLFRVETSSLWAPSPRRIQLLYCVCSRVSSSCHRRSYWWASREWEVSPHPLRNLLLRMRGAGAGCLAAPPRPPPPNLLALTPHFSLLLGLSSPLESIAWVNVCLGVRCVFHSCREDKKGEEKRGLE